MVTCYVYILGASSAPDSVDARVPFEIDENEIFFGPCKKPLRAKLKKELNISHENQRVDLSMSKDEIYFVGLNASNPKKERKIVWAGKLQIAMTFNCAYNKLTLPKYQKIKGIGTNITDFPLHVVPATDGIGYEHVGELHSNEQDWITDLIDLRYERRNITIDGNTIRAINNHIEFSRDICFIFNNIFFARRFGRGINISENKNILNIFKSIRKDADAYCIFGKDTNGNSLGKTGSQLELNGNVAKSLIEEIKNEKTKIIKGKKLEPISTNKNGQRC